MFDYPITVGFVFPLDANNPEKAQNRWLFSFKTSKKKDFLGRRLISYRNNSAEVV